MNKGLIIFLVVITALVILFWAAFDNYNGRMAEVDRLQAEVEALDQRYEEHMKELGLKKVSDD